MSQISINHLTFCHEGSFESVFEDVSFSIDSEWRLGLIGRNGKGKTTLLQLLLGIHHCRGAITTSAHFDYFPYTITEEWMGMCAAEWIETLKPDCEEWRVICELTKLDLSAELLYRPFCTLSHGERTKVCLAVLFSEENECLLIDEPTNHLDLEARETVKRYLQGKQGFILASHDRDLLDACVDHVLVLNRNSIEVQKGNFSSWQENKSRRDHFEKMEHEKRSREIASLKRIADQSGRWAQKNEDSKIGFHPLKEHDRSIATRAYIGSKTKKMQKRVKQFERRMARDIAAKEELLHDLEEPVVLKVNPLSYHSDRLIYCRELTVGYKNSSEAAVKHVTFELKRGERVVLQGKNGCGKSTLLKSILAENRGEETAGMHIVSGELQVGSGLIISYINQDTSFLKGTIRKFCRDRGLEESLFFTLLRQLDFERSQFDLNIEDFSDGQKKKVMIAASLMTPAHLYIWDEPLNYIDVFSRMQIEELLLRYQPTMLLVEHDIRFQQNIATRVVEVGERVEIEEKKLIGL